MQAKGSPKKTKDLLIVFATLAEAQGTIRRLQAKQENDLYIFEGGALFICGIGALTAAVNLAALSAPFTTIWNIGLAAAPSRQEGLFPVGRINKYIFMPPSTSLHSRTFFQLPELIIGEGLSLLTTDFPIHDKTLDLKTDLIDMEGYGIALHCQKMQKKLTMWKIVSDFAEEGGESRIREKIDTLSEEIATFIYGSL